MLFVEVFRLIVAVAGALAGLAIGNQVNAGAGGRFLGAAIGVLLGYVIGGIIGRLMDRGVKEAARSLRDVPAPELLAGAFLGGLGLLVGVVICVPLFVVVGQPFDYVLAAAVGWSLGAIGLKLGMNKGRQLAEALGVTKRLAPLRPDVERGGDVVDTSAVMDRSFLVIGRAGLFGPELLLPELVADELATLAAGPDPVSSRRARRAIEAIDLLRDRGLKVTVIKVDVPEAESIEDKVIELAGRLDARVITCSADVARRLEEDDRPVLDLRRLASDLAPDHVPGERLRVDLVRAGRQERQAVGFLADGDMVVVNDADQLIGKADVEVVVLSTRPTNQGLLVFARLG